MYEFETLSNGVRIIGEPMPFLRTLSMGIFVRAGSEDEALEENGLSHCLEHMVFKGTHRRSARQIAEETDKLGGQFNAGTSKEITTYYARVLDEKMEDTLDLLADLAFSPALDAQELAKEKSVILEEIAMVEDTPEDVVHEQLMRAHWGDHPAARTILGPPSVVEGLTVEQIEAYHSRMYVPENVVLSIAGNYNMAEVKAAAERRMAGLRSGGAREALAKPSIEKSCVLRKEKDIEQLHLCLGFPGLEYGDLDAYPLAAFNLLFGSAMSSRLFQRIREDHGLAYSIYSYHASMLLGGIFAIYSACSPQNGEQVVELVAEEIRKVLEGMAEEEVSQARDQLKTGYLMGLESTGSRMNGDGYAMSMLGRVRTTEEVVEIIEGITAEDVLRVARQTFSQQPFSASLVGPGKAGRRGGKGIDFDPALYLGDF